MLVSSKYWSLYYNVRHISLVCRSLAVKIALISTLLSFCCVAVQPDKVSLYYKYTVANYVQILGLIVSPKASQHLWNNSAKSLRIIFTFGMIFDFLDSMQSPNPCKLDEQISSATCHFLKGRYSRIVSCSLKMGTCALGVLALVVGKIFMFECMYGLRWKSLQCESCLFCCTLLCRRSWNLWIKYLKPQKPALSKPISLHATVAFCHGRIGSTL